MGEYGGKYEHYYSKSTVSHIIATMLPDSKIQSLKYDFIILFFK